MAPNKTIVYPDACADMLSCYFNNTSPPTRFDLALVGYAYGTWVTPVNLSEIMVSSSTPYSRRRVGVSVVTNSQGQVVEDFDSFQGQSDPLAEKIAQLKLTEFTTGIAPRFAISGGLQTVNDSNKILGWAMLGGNSPNQPFTNTNNVICGAPFETPIEPTMMKTYITVNPFIIQAGRGASASNGGYAYPEMIIYDVLNYRMLRKYFGGIVDVTTPELEVALVQSVAYSVDLQDRARLNEVGNPSNSVYSRQSIVPGSGTVSVVSGVAQITWPDVVFACDTGEYISGYAIVIKSATDTKTPLDVLDPTTSGVLAYAPFQNPITAPAGLSISIVPTIKLSYGTPY